MKNKKNELIKDLKILLKDQNLGVLATSLCNNPYTSLVGFFPKEDLKEIYFTTLKNTTKYRNMEKNPIISMLIDTRGNNQSDFKESIALTVLGKVKTVLADERIKIKSQYLIRFPQLKDFVEDPKCAIMKIVVSKYLLVQRFQDVSEIFME